MHIITNKQYLEFMNDSNQRFGQAFLNSLPRDIYEQFNECDSRKMTDLFYETNHTKALDILLTTFGHLFQFNWEVS